MGRFQYANVNRDWKRAMARATEAETQRAIQAGAYEVTPGKIQLMFEPGQLIGCGTTTRRLLLAFGNKDIVQNALGHAKVETTNILHNDGG